MPSRSRRRAAPSRSATPALLARRAQLELFPTPVEIVAVDPREAIGHGTHVRALYRVRYGTEPRPHMVFHDRHGWYCDEHGAACPACTAVLAQRA